MAHLFFILFLTCLFLPVYSYLIFPLYLKIRANKVSRLKNKYEHISSWPDVTIVFSVYNEERVIKQKLESILNSDYPKDKLHVLIGSDNSTDKTNEIIEEYQKKHSNISLIKKNGRTGKLKIINELVDIANTEQLVFTDANVIFKPQTIKALVYNLIEKQAQMVCGNIMKFSPKNQGISDQEIFYMNFENKIKYHESLNYNFIVGVEGGCYAMSKSWFVKVPDGFLMDDFFITLSVIEKNGKVLFEPEAVCFEDVNDSPLVEFKRKIRISLGNFRNLYFYKHLLWPLHKGFGFAFFSHKVLRWHTPFVIILSFFLSFILMFHYWFFIYIILTYSAIIILPMITIILEKLNLKLPIINALGHFILMNLALLIGFIKYISATNDSSWEPPKRNV